MGFEVPACHAPMPCTAVAHPPRALPYSPPAATKLWRRATCCSCLAGTRTTRETQWCEGRGREAARGERQGEQRQFVASLLKSSALAHGSMSCLSCPFTHSCLAHRPQPSLPPPQIEAMVGVLLDLGQQLSADAEADVRQLTGAASARLAAAAARMEEGWQEEGEAGLAGEEAGDEEDEEEEEEAAAAEASQAEEAALAPVELEAAVPR